MNHVIDRITDWIKTNGKLSHEGRSFTVTSIHDSDSKFIAGLHICDGFELLHIGLYPNLEGEVCGDPEFVLQIRDGEFTRITAPEDSREDGDCVDRLIEFYNRLLRTSPAPNV
jgi:hypothetical protein